MSILQIHRDVTGTHHTACTELAQGCAMDPAASSRNVRRLLAMLLVAFSTGCGTIQQVVPPVPLGAGKNEFRIGLGYSTSPFSGFSCQMGGYVFTGQNDAVGLSFAGLLPSSVSYVHYWPSPSGSAQVQLHYNDLMGVSFNPTLQLKVGLSSTQGKVSHSGTLGIGYYHTSFLHLLSGSRVREGGLVPSASYQLKSDAMIFESEVLYGMTKYFVHYYKEHYLQPADGDEVAVSPSIPLRIAHSSVLNIKEQEEGGFAPAWGVTLDSTHTLFIANRDPHADCWSCGLKLGQLNAVHASPDHRVYWLWMGSGDYPWAPTAEAVRELNMKKIFSDYRSGGDLILSEDPDLAEQAAARVHSGLQDIFFSVSRVTWPR